LTEKSEDEDEAEAEAEAEIFPVSTSTLSKLVVDINHVQLKLWVFLSFHKGMKLESWS